MGTIIGKDLCQDFFVVWLFKIRLLTESHSRFRTFPAYVSFFFDMSDRPSEFNRVVPAIRNDKKIPKENTPCLRKLRGYANDLGSSKKVEKRK